MTETTRRVPPALRRLRVAATIALTVLAVSATDPVRASPDPTNREPAVPRNTSLRTANPRLHVANPLDVEMRDASDRRVRLADFKGSIVLVDLWASWCADCELSFPALDRISREYGPRGVKVVAVNLDERRKDATSFLERRPSDMRVLFDPRARLLEAFGAPGIPSSYLIDRQGTVRFAHGGYRPDTEAKYREQLDSLLAEAPPK
jgi:thiol-disulfide isomerase/thioredoxin